MIKQKLIGCQQGPQQGTIGFGTIFFCFQEFQGNFQFVGPRGPGKHAEKFGGGVKERLATPLDVLATIYYLLGIPLDTHYEDSTGRPVSIVDSGKPIRELL